MLQRQQANAVIAARTRIVAGAVGMVEMALAELQKNGVVQLDEERKAQMVSNLLVVLCSDHAARSRWSTPARCTEDAAMTAPCIIVFVVIIGAMAMRTRRRR